MNKNFAWVGQSIFLGAFLAGSVGVGGAIALQNKPLESAIRAAVPSQILQNEDLLNRTEYFVGEVDLNGDGVKEAIVVIASPMCGVNECPAFVYQRLGKVYQQIGGFQVQSDNAAIGVLKSKQKGWFDLAAQVYLRSSVKTVWKGSRFSGSEYTPTYEDVGPPSQAVLRLKRGTGSKMVSSSSNLSTSSDTSLPGESEPYFEFTPRQRNLKRGSISYLPWATEFNPRLDSAVRQTMKEEILRYAPSVGSYAYQEVDINNDGRKDAFVFISGASGSGSGGDHTWIFKNESTGYQLTDIFTHHTSLGISLNPASQWSDILIDVPKEEKYNGAKRRGVAIGSNQNAPFIACSYTSKTQWDDSYENKGIFKSPQHYRICKPTALEGTISAQVISQFFRSNAPTFSLVGEPSKDSIPTIKDSGNNPDSTPIAAPLPKTAGTARPPSPQDIALLDRAIRDQKPKPKIADRTHMKPFTNNLLKPFVGGWTSSDNQQYFVYPGKGRKTCIIVENGSTQNLHFGIAVGNATGTDMNVGTGRMFKTENDGVLALRTPDSDQLVPLYAAAITADLTDGNREAMKDNGCMTGFPGLPAGNTNSPNPFDKPKPSNSPVCPKNMFPATVDPIDPKYNHQSPSHAFVETAGIFKDGTTKDGRKISAKTRCNFFRELTHPSGKPKRTWLIIHGLNNDAYSKTSATPALADAIAAKYPNDRVIALDWSEASNNQGKIVPLSPDSVYYAATWIRPVAETSVKALKEQYGIDDVEAKNSLNLLGHSLGSLMSAEIADIYTEGVNSIIALDPPTQETIHPFGGYDLDGRTPGYEMVTKNGLVRYELPGKIIKDNIEPDRPKCFGSGQSDDVKKSGCKQPGKKLAKFTRAFVGSGSLLGNQGFAASADESFQMNFIDVRGVSIIDALRGEDSSRWKPEAEHGDVVKTFINIISQESFKNFFSLESLYPHRNIKRGWYGHSGVIRVNIGNIPNQIFLDHIDTEKGSKGSLSISLNGKVYYRPVADKIIGSGPSLDEAGSIDSLFPVR